MIMLTTKQILHLHNMLLAATGGLDGVRDSSLLDSAQNSAFQTFDGKELYISVQKKTCRIALNIAKNHPFLDGNKRIAIFVMLILFRLNNFSITCSQEELIKIGLGLADGSIDYDLLVEHLKNKVYKKFTDNRLWYPEIHSWEEPEDALERMKEHLLKYLNENNI